jgi:hypothetical protein
LNVFPRAASTGWDRLSTKTPLFHLNDVEAEWEHAHHPGTQQKLASLGALICIVFCGSFCGPEVFLTDMAGLKQFFEQVSDPTLPSHVIIPLLGRFKNEVGGRYHFTPLAAITSSGINVHRWISRLIEVCTQANHLQGPAFCDFHVQVTSSSNCELDLLDRIESAQN